MRVRSVPPWALLGLGVWLTGAEACFAADTAAPPAVQPKSPKAAKSPWDVVLDDGVRSGVDRARLKTSLDRLAKAGLDPAAAAQILAPAFEARKLGLPWEPVLSKVDEGVLKKAGTEALSAASRGRLESLARARAVAAAAASDLSTQDGRSLITAISRALESGVPEAALQGGFQRGQGRPSAQLKPVVEAAEALHLGGFEAEGVELLMGDCLVRKLRREEILRVVRFALDKKRQGLGTAEVRQALWESAPPAKKRAAIDGGPAPGGAPESPGQLKTSP